MSWAVFFPIQPTADSEWTNVLKAFESLDGNVLEGLTISLGKEDHQAMDTVYLTSYGGGDFLETKRVMVGK
jgi:hypothetical protein